MNRWNDARLSRDQQREMKRNAVLREAGRAFKRNGFRKTSLNDIAKALNVTKGALYHYVRNKQEILFRCHEMSLDIGEDALTRAHAEGGNGAEKVSILIRHLVENMLGDLGDVAVLTEVEALQPNYRKLIQKRRDAFDRGFRSILEEGIADGSVRNCDVRMAGFWAIGAVNWIPKWFSPGGELSASELAEMYAQFVIGGVGANGHRND